MPNRVSGFRGTWQENRRPYLTLAPDAYVAIQGETSVVACGECRRKIDINKYLTSISTEASVDSPPGSATVNLSIPDNDITTFYVEGEFVIIPMMEMEIFAKGYYSIGGVPQYYRIFWGVVSSITKNWSNGVTTYSISCKDILRWWELTNVTINPAFTGAEGGSAGNFQMFCNQFAGMNPYTIIIALAKEAMGDFSITDGSFMSFKPELGVEKATVGRYAKDIMAYWQLKFGNIWNALVLYGTTGTAYTFRGTTSSTTSPYLLAAGIFSNEADRLNLNQETNQFKIQPHEIAAYKVDIAKAADVSLFQNETQTKLSVALTARDQIQYEFYCDTTGDIVFKPPFYNINVIPNKPVSWINDFEIIDESITDSEAEVVTHMTSSGNAFGGTVDYGVTDEITVPRTGVMDWHLLKRYGWRRQDFQCEWAGNPKKLFWFLIDHMDRINAKRHNGSMTIPMRPELRMGFPVWVPKYDSFFYVNAISHSYTSGGQATTTITLVAKRSKFIAPKNIGRITRSGTRTVTKMIKDNKTVPIIGRDGKPTSVSEPTYTISFDSKVGQTAGLGSENEQDENAPLIIRDPKTGKILGYPNVVMTYRTTYDGVTLTKQMSRRGSKQGHKPNKNKKTVAYSHQQAVTETFDQLQSSRRAALVSRLRQYRYEAGMTNAGLYDYAEDVNGDFKELALVPATSITWSAGSKSATDTTGALQKGEQYQGQSSEQYMATRKKDFEQKIAAKQKELTIALTARGKASTNSGKASSAFRAGLVKNHKGHKGIVEPAEYTGADLALKQVADSAKALAKTASDDVTRIQAELADLQTQAKQMQLLQNVNVTVRPVSDEYGFEVIGHNRYGRGVFVDRGQVTLNSGSPLGATNELGIQFSAVGGLLTTDPPKISLGPNAATFSEAFEKMQPDDYVTGAALRPNGKMSIVDQRTFSAAINKTITSSTDGRGGAIFAEVDTLRRAQSLLELQPTMTTGLDDANLPTCNCTLEKFQWFSVLPQSVLDAVLQPKSVGISSQDPYYLQAVKYVDSFNGNLVDSPTSKRVRPFTVGSPISSSQLANPIEERVNKPVAVYVNPEKQAAGADDYQVLTSVPKNGLPDEVKMYPGSGVGSISQTVPNLDSFLAALNLYMQQRFVSDYQANEDRETIATGSALGVMAMTSFATPVDYLDDADVFGSEVTSLMESAANGDPDALDALKNQANWNFGASEQALKNFNSVANDFNKNVNVNLADLNGSIWNPAFGSTMAQGATGIPIPGVSTSSAKISEAVAAVQSEKPQVQPSTPQTRKLKFDPAFQDPESDKYNQHTQIGGPTTIAPVKVGSGSG